MARIKVVQSDGEVLLSRGGAEPTSYPVKDGVVEVADDVIDIFLRAVPGSELAPASKPAPAGNPGKEV